MLALSLTAAAGAWAEGADDLRFRASVGMLRDSNLFRLPDGANTQALIGQPSAAETITITTLGVNYDKAYSLQRVELDLSVVNYDYRTFNYLDFSAINYRAAWRWSYTPRLRGNLSSTRSETLNSFADFRGFNLRNQRTDATNRLDAEYELDARWRLLGGLTHITRKNDLELIEDGDYRNLTAHAGVRYVLPSGSSASYIVRSTDGDYINRRLPSVGFLDSGFSQAAHELQLDWRISRDTSATFRAGHRNRNHSTYPQRDFSGMTGGANLNWAITGKSALSAGWTRELGPYETANSNYVQTDRFSIGPVWQLSPKATVRVQLEHAVRDYRGAPGPVIAPQRRDTNREASISLDWQPYQFLTLGASLQNARRSSNLAGLDYSSNMVNLTAQFTY